MRAFRPYRKPVKTLPAIIFDDQLRLPFGGAQGTRIAKITNPIPGSTLSIIPDDGALQWNADGVTLEVGPNAAALGRQTYAFERTYSAAQNSPRATVAAVICGVHSQRQVATRSTIPNTYLAGARQWMTRDPHYARGVVRNFQVRWPNFYVNVAGNAYETGIGTSTYETWVEYPQDVYTRIQTGGLDVAVAPDNGVATTDLCSTVEIPDGALFWIWGRFENTTGFVYNNRDANTTLGQKLRWAASGLQAAPSAGMAATATNASFGTATIIAMSGRPAPVLFGDSRTSGAGLNAVPDASGDTGETAPSIGPRFPYIDLSASSDKLAPLNVSHANRLQLAGDGTDFVENYLINDIVGDVITGAQAFARRQTFWGTLAATYPGRRIFSTTITPDSRPSNLVATAGNVAVNALNAMMRGGPAGVTAVFELSDAVSTARDSGLSKPGYSSDYIHLNTTGWIALRDSAAINPNVIEAAVPAPV